MRMLFFCLVLFTIGCTSIRNGGGSPTRLVSFDEFFDGQIASLPLALRVPVEYEHASELPADLSYAYWMRPDAVAAALETEDLPTDSGYMYGKISMSEAYDPASGRFSSESVSAEEWAEMGAEILEERRSTLGGYPCLRRIARMNGTIVCQLYVGMNIASNAAYVSYRPPANNLDQARALWRNVVGPIK